MKKFNVGMNFLTLPEASKAVAKELGRPRDKGFRGMIYRDMLTMIKNGELPFEKHGERMYKIKKAFIKDIAQNYSSSIIR